MPDTQQPTNAIPSPTSEIPAPRPSAPRPARKGRKFSRPLMTVPLTLKTGHAQRVMERSFYATAASLGRISTILYVLAEDDQAEEVNSMINRNLADFIDAIKVESAKVQALLDEESIDRGPDYSNEQATSITFMSPAVYKLISAMTEFDKFVRLIDTAWFAGLVGNKDHTGHPYTWRNKFLRLNTDIIALERRAQRSAESQGKGDAVKDAVEAMNTDDSTAADGEALATEIAA